MSSKSASPHPTPRTPDLRPEDRALFRAAWKTARARHGFSFTFYLPGMIRYGRIRGRYPAISITGDRCELQCEHCRGKLLAPMLKADSPHDLIRISKRLSANGAKGILLTGGSNRTGRLPWERYVQAIGTISRQTPLFMSAHTGFPDARSCRRIQKAGVKQGLIDVMGDAQTAREIYHLNGMDPVFNALEAIRGSGLQLVPHIVAGLDHGRISAEYAALDIVRRFRPDSLVIVVLTPLEGTPMARVTPPSPIEIARLIATARLMMPEIPISLGCERPRNRQGWEMERLAIRAGATRMAVWSDPALLETKRLGLRARFRLTCCSLDGPAATSRGTG